MISMVSTDMNQPPWGSEYVFIVSLFLNKSTASVRFFPFLTYPNDFHSYLTQQLVNSRTGAISFLCLGFWLQPRHHFPSN